MLFKDLADANKNWSDGTFISVIRNTEDPFRLNIAFAKCLYGNLKVLWFQDNLVMVVD